MVKKENDRKPILRINKDMKYCNIPHILTACNKLLVTFWNAYQYM